MLAGRHGGGDGPRMSAPLIAAIAAVLAVMIGFGFGLERSC